VTSGFGGQERSDSGNGFGGQERSDPGKEWSPTRLGNLSGKRIIVTGATNGVGLGTTRALVNAGAHVILAVRNTELGAQRAAELGGQERSDPGNRLGGQERSDSGNGFGGQERSDPGNRLGGTTSVLRLDLADQGSVRAFPALLDEVCDGVDVLINNAGALTQVRTDTVDGFEMTIATNFLGPFALTNLIFDRVRSQIINVGSNAHKSATLRLDDMHLRRNKWNVMGAYARSKLATMLWGLELDRRLRAAKSPVVSQLVDPGWVASNISQVSDKRLMSFAHRVVQTAANLLANDVDAGAGPTLYCISEPIPPGSYVGCSGVRGLRGGPVLIGRSAVACDYDLAARLWEFAERETGTTLPVLG